jgi:hypothetical protein
MYSTARGLYRCLYSPVDTVDYTPLYDSTLAGKEFLSLSWIQLVRCAFSLPWIEMIYTLYNGSVLNRGVADIGFISLNWIQLINSV